MASKPRLAAIRGLTLALAVAGCDPGSQGAREVPGAASIRLIVDRADCAAEAMLLGEPAAVLIAPLAEATIVVELAAGTPVYPCGESAGFRAIMYPGAGEPADCSRREPGNECPTGWIDLATVLETAG